MGAFIVGGLGFFLTVIVTIILILANESMRSYETKYPVAGERFADGGMANESRGRFVL